MAFEMDDIGPVLVNKNIPASAFATKSDHATRVTIMIGVKKVYNEILQHRLSRPEIEALFKAELERFFGADAARIDLSAA